MKHRRFVIATALVMGVAAAIAGMALYSSHSVKASAPSLTDVLNSVPADYQFVSGINVQRLVTSPYFTKFRQSQSQTLPVGSNLATFIEKTGVDPARDVSYLVFGGAAQSQGVAVVGGTFDQEKIVNYIKSKSSPIEIGYAGTRVFIIPDKTSGDKQNGIAFINDREIAVGTLDSIKSVLDTSTGSKKNILSNPGIASLIGSINTEEMFWFAGNASDLLARAPVTTPLGSNISSIRSILGTFDISDAVVGKITATAVSAEAAGKLTDMFKGFVALGQLSGNQNPDLKRLLEGVVISLGNSQVTLSLNIPLDVFENMQRGRGLVMGRSSTGAGMIQFFGMPGIGVKSSEDPNAVKPPMIIAQPLPPYTQEARDAHIEGKVVLTAVIRKDGSVNNIKIQKGLGYGLDESAVQTIATQWRFEPGTYKGKPVEVQSTIEVSFRLPR